MINFAGTLFYDHCQVVIIKSY